MYVYYVFFVKELGTVVIIAKCKYINCANHINDYASAPVPQSISIRSGRD